MCFLPVSYNQAGAGGLKHANSHTQAQVVRGSKERAERTKEHPVFHATVRNWSELRDVLHVNNGETVVGRRKR